MELGSKTISVDFEVVDSPLDYNLLLGRSWFYSMTTITSSIFRIIQFPNQGKIDTIDQLDYCTPDLCTQTTNIVPLLEGFKLSYEQLGLVFLKYSSLIGTFPISTPNPPPIVEVNMISSMVQRSLESSDTWVVPDFMKLNCSKISCPLALLIWIMMQFNLSMSLWNVTIFTFLHSTHFLFQVS